MHLTGIALSMVVYWIVLLPHSHRSSSSYCLCGVFHALQEFLWVLWFPLIFQKHGSRLTGSLCGMNECVNMMRLHLHPAFGISGTRFPMTPTKLMKIMNNFLNDGFALLGHIHSAAFCSFHEIRRGVLELPCTCASI